MSDRSHTSKNGFAGLIDNGGDYCASLPQSDEGKQQAVA